MIYLSVLVSGNGTTLDNLAFHCTDEFEGILYDIAKIKRVVADCYCKALEVAQSWNIPAFVVSPKEYTDEKKWSELILPNDVDLHIMAGFLKHVLVPPWAKNKILNIHPSLLPAYGGKGMYGIAVHKSVIGNREELSGCTVHFVDDEYDHGEIIAQAKVVVQPWDNALSLQKAVQEVEKRLYPRAILQIIKQLS